MCEGRRPTLTDVASEAGVSLKTVSRVINGVPSVAPHLADRVNAAATRLGYRHNRMAAMLRSGRADMIGMIIRDMTNPFYATLAAGAADVAESHGSLLFLASSEGDVEREKKLLDEMLDRRVDGVLLTPAHGVNPTLAAETKRQFPVVALDVAPEGVTVDVVSFNNETDTHRAMTAAINAGYRRFGMIFDSYELNTMQQRANGARRALSEAGLAIDPTLVRAGQHTVAEANEVAAQLLSLAEPPDAIFCANNVAAIGAASQIRQRNAAVAIVSYDDFPLSRTLQTRVFIIDHDTRAMGASAARLLFERITSPRLPARHVPVPTTLEVNGLTQTASRRSYE